MASGSQGAKARLMQEYRGLEKEKWVNIELNEGSLFRWNIGLIVVNSESYYDGAYFRAEMTFTNNYPYSPPTFKFLRPIYHPNIYPDGKLCISILHAPGEDIMSGEAASERWSPLQGVESVLRSVLLLLDDPECSSPANVDAGVLYRKNRQAYIERATSDVEKSKKDIPRDFVMPTSLVVAPPPKFAEDEDFWAESDAEDDFGGSASSGEDEEMADDDEDGEQEFDDSDDDTKEAQNDHDEDEDM